MKVFFKYINNISEGAREGLLAEAVAFDISIESHNTTLGVFSASGDSEDVLRLYDINRDLIILCNRLGNSVSVKGVQAPFIALFHEPA